MKASKIFAAALAVLAIGQPVTSHAKISNQSYVNKTIGNEMSKPSEVRTRKKFDLPFEIGGIPMISEYYNPGIPPKIYGELFKKRGTHRRTNRK